MLRMFLKDTAIYAVSSAVAGSLTILLLPFLTRKLSPQEYGVMDLLVSAFAIVNILVPLDITQALARYYPSGSLNERYRLVSTGLWFTCLMYLLFLIFSAVLIGPITDIVIGDKAYMSVSLVSSLSMMVYGVFGYLQVQLRWMRKPVQYMIANIFFIAISCILTVFFIEYFAMRIDGFFWARIIASLLAGLIVLYYSKTSYKLILDIQTLKLMLTFSVPLVLSSIGILVSLYIDRFIIRAMLTLNDVGLYSACARVAAIGGSIVTVVNFALTPLVYATYEDPKTPDQLAFLFKIFVYAMLGLILLLLLFSKQILTLMVGENYSEGHYVLPLLAASFIMAGLYNCAPGLWLAKKTKLIASINIASALLNTLLCLLFIPYYGYLGAAIATLVSATVTVIASTSLAQKYYYISYDWLRINSAIVITAFSAYLILRT